MSKEIPIFFSADDNYIPYLDVAIASLIENASKEYRYRIIVLNTGLRPENMELVVLGDDGKSKSIVITEAIFSLSTAEGYTALLYDEKCTVFNNDLTAHCEVPTSSKISDCLVNDDGSVLLLSDNSAIFYVK